MGVWSTARFSDDTASDIRGDCGDYLGSTLAGASSQADGVYGILSSMSPHHVPWEAILLGLFKLLKTFGIIPGAIAAYGVGRVYQKWRQRRAMEGWPATDALIQNGQTRREGLRVWVEITYSYFVGEYRSGTYVRRFRRQEDAEEFIRQVKDKRVQVHYSDSDADHSVILDRDLEMIAMLAPTLS